MKKVTPNPFNALVVGVLLMLCASFLQSCKKNQSKESAPAANIVTPANTPLDATVDMDSTLFKNLVANWPLRGTNYDLSGNGNKGVLHDLRASKEGQYVFNGHQSYIAVPDAAPLRLSNTDFSISVKLSLDSLNSGLESDVIDKRTGAADAGWHLAIEGAKGASPGALVFGSGDGMPTAVGKTILNVSIYQTYTLTCVYTLSNHTLKIYVNGALDTTVNNISSPNAVNNAKLCIGRNNPDATGNANFFAGAISDIYMFNRAITISEVNKLYSTADQLVEGGSATHLIAYWPLAHTYDDVSGDNYNGTGHNITSSTDRFGNPLGASKFNGKNSYIIVANDSIGYLRLSGTFTINAWIKIDAYNKSTSSALFSKRYADPNDGWNFALVGDNGTPTGALSFGPGRGKGIAYGVVVIPLGGWHMITCTYRYPNMKFYVDGVVDHQVVMKSQPNRFTTAPLYIGFDNTTNAPSYFNGSISDVRIYEQAFFYPSVVHGWLYALN